MLPPGRDQQEGQSCEEDPEHQEELHEAGGIDHVWQQSPGLGAETQVEGQIGDDANAGQRQENGDDLLPEARAEAQALITPAQGIGHGDQENVDGEVPGVEEAHRAHQQARQWQSPAIQPEGVHHRAPHAGRGCVRISGDRSGPQHQRQSDAHHQQGEGQRQHVGVHIAQNEAELREFVDDFLRGGAGEVVVVDGAGGPPPPPAPGIGIEAAGHRRFGQLLDIEEVEGGGRKQAPGVQHFQQHFQITHNRHEHPRQQTVDPAGQPGSGPLWVARHQSVGQPEAFCDRKGEYCGQSQIEDHRGGHARKPGQHRQQHIAEIIVTDAIARQPRILRREEPRMEGAVDECDLHRLFGAGDIGIVGPEEGPARHRQQEKQFDPQPVPPVCPQISQQGATAVRIPAQARPAQPQTCAQHQHQGDEDAADVVSQQPETGAQPQHVAGQQQSQRLGEDQTPIGQGAEQPPGQGQGDKPQHFKGKPEFEEIGHPKVCRDQKSAGATDRSPLVVGC